MDFLLKHAKELIIALMMMGVGEWVSSPFGHALRTPVGLVGYTVFSRIEERDIHGGKAVAIYSVYEVNVYAARNPYFVVRRVWNDKRYIGHRVKR